MPLSGFHPTIERWFGARFAEPTEPQRGAWPVIQAGRNALIAAPTGSGKTFAAFLAAIDSLLRQGLEGTLRDETQVVYVSPLKALSNDVQKNLAEPLAEIRHTLEAMCLPDVEIRTLVRTGDTPAAERQAMVHRPPHIVVTTPESLFLILTSGRATSAAATSRCRSSGSSTSRAGGCSASGSRRPKSPSKTSRPFSPVPGTRPPTPASSIPGTPGRSISRSRSSPLRSRQ